MKKAAFLIITLLFLSSPILAQKEFSDIDAVGKAVDEKIRGTLKDWDCHNIEPMSVGNTSPSPDLRIEQWVLNKRQVRLVLHIHSSAEDAVEALRQFAGARSSYLHGLGDEAYFYSGRNGIVFRKGNLLVYLSAIVIKETYSQADKIDPKYATGIDLDDERASVRQFAHLVASALKRE